MTPVEFIKLQCRVCKTKFFVYKDFFESMYVCRNKRCQRLVNMATERIEIKDKTPQSSLEGFTIGHRVIGQDVIPESMSVMEFMRRKRQ